MSGEGMSRTARVEAIFHEASALPREAREAFVRQRAGDDASLVREVLSLLSLAEDSRDGFLETPVTLAGLVEGDATDDSLAGETIGSYRLVRRLGEGGMGVVYLAEQQSPRRRVALKVIRAHLGSAQARKRFAHEAQALGRLHHPGVAQIYEARLEGAQPFFAMEYVEGMSLGKHAAEAKLSTRDRLALVAEIADAAQHAHERGIVHRDLKPGNILVGEDGRAKVLDFGVSRLVDDELRVNTLRTEAGQLLGTVAYMSPEQASGNPDAVDARTDVYSLGVIAFELLTGRLPFDLAGKSLPEATRIVAESEPASLGAIDRSLRGDYETIVRTAMERDRDRRYRSAAALADDIRRALRNEPIHARPPSAAYQFRKFASRHRAIVVGATAVFTALVLGIAGTSIGLARALESERKATEAARAEEAARVVAQREAATARAINDFLVHDLLGAATPERRGRSARVADVLDDAARSATSLSRQPLVLAEVRQTLGEAYRALELHKEAIEQLTLARAIRVRELGEGDPATLKVDSALAGVDLLQGRLEEAIAGYERVSAAQKAALGPTHPDVLETMADYALALERVGRYEEALAIARETALARIEALGEDARPAIVSMRKVAAVASALGQLDEAKTWIERAERALAASGRENDPELVHLLDVKASVLLARDRTGPAIEAMERSLEVAAVAHGPRSSLVGVSLVNLGNAYVQAGDRARGRELYAQAVEILRERLGPDHDWTMMSVDNLAEVTARLGEPDAAEAMLEENVARRRRVLGEDHPSIAYSYSALGMAMASRGEWSRAAAQFERASGVHAASSGDRSVPYLSALSNLAFCLFRAGDYERAEDAQRRVIEVERATTSGGAGVLWGDFRSLVRINLAQGDAGGALEAVEELRSALLAGGEPSPDRARMFAALEARARLLANGGEAEVEALKAAADALLTSDGRAEDVTEAVGDLAKALRARGDVEGADAWEARLAAWSASK